MGGDGGRPRREAMILAIARVCVAISALDHFELGRGSRSEIASSFVLAASSFALISSNFTPKVASSVAGLWTSAEDKQLGITPVRTWGRVPAALRVKTI